MERLLLWLLFASEISIAQVGINTAMPSAASVLDVKSLSCSPTAQRAVSRFTMASPTIATATLFLERQNPMAYQYADKFGIDNANLSGRNY